MKYRFLMMLIIAASLVAIFAILVTHRSQVLRINGCEGQPGYQSDAGFKGVQYVDRRTQPEIIYYTNCEGKLVLKRWYDEQKGSVERETFQVIPGDGSIKQYPISLEDGTLYVVEERSEDAAHQRDKFAEVKKYIDQTIDQ
jgi:hypothetical protein